MSDKTRSHGVRHAEPVDGRAVEGWLARCSCGFSAGNFLAHAQAVDEGHTHLDRLKEGE